MEYRKRMDRKTVVIVHYTLFSRKALENIFVPISIKFLQLPETVSQQISIDPWRTCINIK